MKMLILLLILHLTYGCGKKVHNEGEIVKSNNIDSAKLFFNEEVGVFDLPISDSASFMFSKIQSFDTCFILLLSKSKNEISGKFLYYPPEYYKGFPELHESNVFLYKAINFKLNIESWNVIKQQVNSLNSIKKKSNQNYLNSVIHPPHYKLYYDNLLISNRTYDNNYFDKLHRIINTSIINKLLLYYPEIDGHIP